MRKCKNCGAPVKKGGGFCTECGAKVKGRGGRTALYILLGIILLAAVSPLLWGDAEPAEDVVPVAALDGAGTAVPSREKYTQLKGDGSDSATVMLYIVGSNLESEGGCATTDLMEILDAAPRGNVNVVVQTGGSAVWQNDVIEGGVCQRYRITDSGMELLQELGQRSMARSEELADFISFSASQYPADRYELILWNHGGGTMGGFGHDEVANEMMSLSQIDSALQSAGVKFDMIGFDACLMATIENAYMLEPYADYLVASEELEPGDGWYYTGWIDALCQNSSIDTRELGRIIVDDYAESYGSYDATTLSLTDLSCIAPAYEKLCAFLDESERLLLDGSDYGSLSNARADARDFGDGEFEQIDIIDYASRTGLASADELIGAVSGAVVHRGGSLTKSYGLAMYFPYTQPESYDNVTDVLGDIGMDEGYTEFFDSFLNVLAGGQITYGQGISPLEELLGMTDEQAQPTEEDFADCEWFDEAAQSYDYEDSGLDELLLSEKGDNYVLHLSDEQWENVVGIELQVWLDDGEGYIDLGSDSLYEFDDDGDLLIGYDNTWVTINGQIVSFYTESYEENDDGSWYNYGYVPCFINDEQRELVLCWSDEYPNGVVLGWREVMAGAGYGAKGVLPLNNGDTVDFIADYYTYDGEYDDWYYIGETLYYDGGELEVSYEDVGDAPCLVFYMLTDIYQSNYFTEALEFTY